MAIPEAPLTSTIEWWHIAVVLLVGAVAAWVLHRLNQGLREELEEDRW